jgi:DNA end-binding protein Ku
LIVQWSRFPGCRSTVKPSSFHHPQPNNVINIMNALRKSVEAENRSGKR